MLEGNFKSEKHKMIVNIRLTSGLIGLCYNKFMAQYDLTMAQFNILRILRGAKEPLTINTVKERMIEKSPNTTRLIDKLLEKNLVLRFQCTEDRRQTFIQISPEGLELLQKIDEKSELAPFTVEGISEQESKLLNELLEKVKISFV